MIPKINMDFNDWDNSNTTSETVLIDWLIWYTVKITFWSKYFYLLDGTYKQNIYLLERKNFAPKQSFVLL